MVDVQCGYVDIERLVPQDRAVAVVGGGKLDG